MSKTLGPMLGLALLASACGSDEGETAEPEPAAAEPTEAAEREEAAPAEASEEAAEAEAAEGAEESAAADESVNLEPPAEGETTTLLSLREGFEADPEAWEGRTVTVRAQFMSATNVGGQLNNIALVVNEADYQEDRLAHSMMCAFGDDAPESVDYTQYDEITVRGTVVERFDRASLDDCQIVD
jgi:hypothetical protein